MNDGREGYYPGTPTLTPKEEQQTRDDSVLGIVILKYASVTKCLSESAFATATPKALPSPKTRGLKVM